MIRVEHLSKVYKNGEQKTHALRDASFHINRGELIAVMGASGSGKTTLLNILGCMDSKTSGDYFYEGENGVINVGELSGKKLENFRKKHISFVFQQFALIHDYTIYQNIEVPLKARNVPAKERRQRINAYMEKLGIEELANKLPAKVSGGQQQRCAIARALVSGCDMILADEPTGALDSQTSEEIMNILVELKNEGRTILMVTHDPLAASYADRVIRIIDGVCEEEVKE